MSAPARDRAAEAPPVQQPTPPEQVDEATEQLIAEMNAALAAIDARKPTCAVPWPMFLVEGPEKAGKTWMAALLTTSQRVGKCFWFEWGMEGVADYYGRIPGTRHEIVRFANWRDLMVKLNEVKRYAKAARALGEKPSVVVVDTMSAEWKTLGKLADWRARRSKKSQQILSNDPNAEITIGPAYWNPVTDMHYELLTLLASIPAIVVLTARGKEVAVIGPDGAPVAGQKAWSVEAHKNLGFDATCWLRVERGQPGRGERAGKPGDVKIVGMWSVEEGTSVRPGVDAPRSALDDKPDGMPVLEYLTFDVLGLDPGTAYCRTVTQSGDGDDRDEERRRQSERELARADQDAERIATEPATEGQASSPASQAALSPWQRLAALFEVFGVGTSAGRLAVAVDMVGRPLEKATDLTAKELTDLINGLERIAASTDEPASYFGQLLDPSGTGRSA